MNVFCLISLRLVSIDATNFYIIDYVASGDASAGRLAVVKEQETGIVRTRTCYCSTSWYVVSTYRNSMVLIVRTVRMIRLSADTPCLCATHKKARKLLRAEQQQPVLFESLLSFPLLSLSLTNNFFIMGGEKNLWGDPLDRPHKITHLSCMERTVSSFVSMRHIFESNDSSHTLIFSVFKNNTL